VILAACALAGVSIGVAGGLFPALRASRIVPSARCARERSAH
jgi:hypothetical protein